MNPETYRGFPRYTGPDPDHRVRKRTEDIDTDWMQDAACQGMSASTFFPEPGDMAAIRLARLTCSTCRVRAACEEASKDEVHGVWAGKTPRERGVRVRRPRT